jgi:hypothetical protein
MADNWAAWDGEVPVPFDAGSSVFALRTGNSGLASADLPLSSGPQLNKTSRALWPPT